MVTVALSILFGLVAFAALAQVSLSVIAGMRRGRLILSELAPPARMAVRARSAPRRGHPLRQGGLVPA